MSRSRWQGSSLLGEADLVVIGAGICGVSAALWAERRGLSVAVLERDTVAFGASGRNAGFLMRGASDNYAATIGMWGRERARTVWRWTEDNLKLLLEEGIDSLKGFRRVPSTLVAVEEVELEQLRASRELLSEDGFEVGWMDTGDDSLWASGLALGALVNPNDASCDPYELVSHLRSKLVGPVAEGQRVVGIEPAGDRLRLVTSGGHWLAERVLVCVNAAARELFPGVGRLIEPNRGQLIAFDGRGLRLDASYYINHGHEYVRQAVDGAVLVGGMRWRDEVGERTALVETSPAIQENLEIFAEKLFGRRPAVLNRWAGTMGFTPDELPVVGPLKGAWDASQVYFCGGFTGHGMSKSFLTARAAVDEMLGGAATPFPLGRFDI